MFSETEYQKILSVIVRGIMPLISRAFRRLILAFAGFLK